MLQEISFYPASFPLDEKIDLEDQHQLMVNSMLNRFMVENKENLPPFSKNKKKIEEENAIYPAT